MAPPSSYAASTHSHPLSLRADWCRASFPRGPRMAVSSPPSSGSPPLVTRKKTARRRSAGLSSLETLALVSVGASVLAVSIPTGYATLRTSKIDEASHALQQQLTGLVSYYEAQRQVLGQVHAHCLPRGAGPIPQDPSAKGVKVVLSDHGEAAQALVAFGFVPAQPTRYRYSFETSAAGCELDQNPEGVRFRLIAEGDLDSDGVLSRFERRGRIDLRGLHVDPLLHVWRRVE